MDTGGSDSSDSEEEQAPDQSSLELSRRWICMRQQAVEAGEVEMAQAFPDIVEWNHRPHWEPFPYSILKDLRKAINEYGLEALFTKGLLDLLFSTFVLTPYNCARIAKILFTTMQYTLFEAEWKKLVKKHMEEMSPLIGLPVLNIKNILLGKGPYATSATQALIPVANLALAKNLALQALRKVPDAGTVTQSFTMIKQEVKEPLMQYAELLRNAINKQIDNVPAQEIVFKSIVIKNANEDCQRILRGLHNLAIAEMLDACRNMGSQASKKATCNDTMVAVKDPPPDSPLQLLCYDCG
ncbi:hypothetical protein BTVI_53913 [Pitangus sulphuratus]|nr:hypothetical protein BTVI_53913 [Pitangus sulphuratus]